MTSSISEMHNFIFESILNSGKEDVTVNEVIQGRNEAEEEREYSVWGDDGHEESRIG